MKERCQPHSWWNNNDVSHNNYASAFVELRLNPAFLGLLAVGPYTIAMQVDRREQVFITIILAKNLTSF